jgi:hypothetical protein
VLHVREELGRRTSLVQRVIFWARRKYPAVRHELPGTVGTEASGPRMHGHGRQASISHGGRRQWRGAASAEVLRESRGGACETRAVNGNCGEDEDDNATRRVVRV